MKTIQIPTTSNPFIVNINNNEYQYRAGAAVEVPDEVAAAIEDALELEPKPNRQLSKLAQFLTESLTEITKSDLDGISNIPELAFYNHDTLQRLAIPDSVTNIDYAAFGNCNGLTSVTIGNGVTTIGANSFECCTNLTNIDIPSHVASIGNYAFRECWSLKRVILRPITPPAIQAETFLNLPNTCAVEVPSAAVDTYKTAEHWNAFANQIKAIEE